MLRVPAAAGAVAGGTLAAEAAVTKHSERPRDWAFIQWVKLQPCILRGVDGAGDCCGASAEADHAGDRFAQGDGRRADDWTCIPLCTEHHRQRTTSSGYFEPMTRLERDAWRQDAIRLTRERWEAWRNLSIPF